MCVNKNEQNYIQNSFFRSTERLRDSSLLDAHRGGEPGPAAVPPAPRPPHPTGRGLAQERRAHPAEHGHQLYHELDGSPAGAAGRPRRLGQLQLRRRQRRAAEDQQRCHSHRLQ